MTAPGVAQSSFAQQRKGEPGADCPTRPIRFVVPFAAGGGTDLVTRLFAQRMWNPAAIR